MSFIQENKIELNIGLKKEYRIIHISDVHASTFSEDDSDENKKEALKAEDIWQKQRTWFADKFHEHYDESHMIPSKQCLINLVDYINKEKPDAALFSGDIIDYYSKSNYSMLVNELKRVECPFLFSCGNHEIPPQRYKEIIGSDNGFSLIDFDEFKIVSLDNSSKEVTIETLTSLKKELEDNKPIIIAIHIPISTDHNKEEMSNLDPYFIMTKEEANSISKEFIDLLVNNKNIKAILCGHIHGYHQSYFAESKPQITASSGLIGWVNIITIK